VASYVGKDIPLAMFVYGKYMAVCSNFKHLSATRVAEIAESTYFCVFSLSVCLEWKYHTASGETEYGFGGHLKKHKGEGHVYCCYALANLHTYMFVLYTM
jgi:hypothetical protein